MMVLVESCALDLHDLLEIWSRKICFHLILIWDSMCPATHVNPCEKEKEKDHYFLADVKMKYS